jgi:hypothetical protein
MTNTTQSALAAISNDELETMRLAFLTMRDEFSVICVEAREGMRDDRHDREIYHWHLEKIKVADRMLDKVRAEMMARALRKGNCNV